MKLNFMREELGDTSEDTCALSIASMSFVCAFQRYLVRFMLDYDIPSKAPLLNYVDDVQDYLYSCLVSRKCCICGKRADLHHEDAVGAGRDREEIIHEGMLALPLCRFHHTEAHTTGVKTFRDKYHLSEGVVLDKFLCKLYGLNAEEESNVSE